MPVRSKTSASALSRIRLSILLVCGAPLLPWIIGLGCSKHPQSSPSAVSSDSRPSSSSQASIRADPNPVPAGAHKFGTTTISWDTGDGSLGEVYVSQNDEPEKRFSGSLSKGSQQANWIGRSEYEFRLYAG